MRAPARLRCARRPASDCRSRVGLPSAHRRSAACARPRACGVALRAGLCAGRRGARSHAAARLRTRRRAACPLWPFGNRLPRAPRRSAPLARCDNATHRARCSRTRCVAGKNGVHASGQHWHRPVADALAGFGRVLAERVAQRHQCGRQRPAGQQVHAVPCQYVAACCRAVAPATSDASLQPPWAPLTRAGRLRAACSSTPSASPSTTASACPRALLQCCAAPHVSGSGLS